jgi:hypothetical protein
MIIQNQKRLDKIEARIQEINSNLKEVELEREICKAVMESFKSKRVLVDDVDCYFVSPVGCIRQLESDCLNENDNAFVDFKSAQRQAQRNTLVYRMRVAALECPVNWNDKEEKYFLSWACDDKETIIQYAQVVRSSQLPHFACYAKLKNFMNSLSKDQQKLLIYGVE